ncbi:MAG: ABATE domain-containing protein, partial [Actinomycetota bacterium]|nr:ABATE domain-containing protein [Actinomycetota bacterium]
METPEPPLLGEPLAVEFANLRFAIRGREYDGLTAPADLAAWLGRVGERLPYPMHARDLAGVGPAHLAMARDLRDAIRRLLSAAVSGASFDASAAEVLNRVVREAPDWHELSVHPVRGAFIRSGADPVRAALSTVASDAVGLLGGSQAATLRACGAPGCVLYFRKDHPRRTCCSARCSNRVRAARH